MVQVSYFVEIVNIDFVIVVVYFVVDHMFAKTKDPS